MKRIILAGTAAFLILVAVFAGGVLAAAPELVVLAPVETGIGSPFLVYISSTEPLEDVVISWEGKQLPLEVERSGDISEAMVLLGTDVGSSRSGPRTIEIGASAGGRSVAVSRTITVADVDFPVQRLSLPEEMVTPPKEVLERIKREREESSRALATMSSGRKWSVPMVRPVPGIITSPYGFRRILNDQPRSPHRGIDYRAAVGDPVRAAADGTVLLSTEHYYAGQCVYLDHGNGVVSVYMHLSERKVKEGDPVSAGDAVGLAGKSGRVTGPHLHFGISLQGMMVDPEPLLAE